MPDALEDILESIRTPFGLGPAATAEPLGNGHINQTLLVRDGSHHLVAQRINTSVFPEPRALVHNARLIEAHLSAAACDRLRVVRHLQGRDGNFLFGSEEDIRVLEYIPGSRSIEVLENTGQAEVAARSFARFSRSLSDFDPAQLEIVIPDFHSPELRWKQYSDALASDRVGRAATCQEDLEFVLRHERLPGHWQRLIGELPVRTCHNDCKINNLLVDQVSGEALAIIDLDTCMPGALLTDFGDLVRTCCSPEAEDSTRLDAVRARPEVYGALARGYTRAWDDAITRPERDSLLEGGMMMCFVVGLRFLTDYLDGDRYFTVSRPAHNLERARNQFRLFQSLLEQRGSLEKPA
jgi:hypothetical protein